MIEVNQATERILSCQFSAWIVKIPLEKSLSRILAEDIFADLDQPPFHRVAMDGIAINKEQLKSTNKFKILKTISAGSEKTELPAGAVCFEIMTGAVLPSNADLVIRYEDLEISGGEAKVLVEEKKLSSNFHVQGSDYRKGDKLLSSGIRIKSTTTAILASAGRTMVQVYDLPRVAILSTGDELVEISSHPKPHQIRWSNGISLKQELCAHGFTDVSLFKVDDNESEMKKKIAGLLDCMDILLLTGGVSAGKYDYVPKLLKECNVQEIFHKVAQRPGKPLWFGKTSKDVFVFGLPGNPVSCLINLRKFVIPFIQQSIPEQSKKPFRAFLSTEIKFSNKLMTYYSLITIENREGKMMVSPLPGNGSGDFFQLRDSDGFIELKPQDAPFVEGSMGDVYLWGNT